LHLQRSFIERCSLGSSTIVRSGADRLGLRGLRDQLLGDGVAAGIEVLRDGDERAGAADEIDVLEGVGGSPSCGCRQRGNQEGSQSALW
jgi:hypothetical protein